MAKQSIDALIEGGKATAAPPLGPALGPTGVNIGQVVAEINKKTGDFKGMKVPVKVTIDTETKEFEISIGTPPAAQLIKKEAGVKSGASNPLTEKVADLLIEQIIKVSNMKQDSLLGNDTKARVREIVGTCQSMGIMVEGMSAADALVAIAEGKFDAKIASGKTELTEEEKKKQEEEKQRLAAELAEKRKVHLAEGNSILTSMEGKDVKKIRQKMTEAGLPMTIVNELAPMEEKK
ncbi:50S ribosomal protein L11 [archaeon]|nr:50S ribosomal protein L11 [archaeon]|tara:strand:+ start:592 stop:1296 length:705 start_codon:yes stop_codon:yes gene_type:complete